MLVGQWQCQAETCKKIVEYDGSGDAIFSFQRRNKAKQWLLFTRAFVDKIVSFVIAARSTYTAATRHLSMDIQSFPLRRQDLVKLGTAALRTYYIPPDTSRCTRCGPNPEFVVMDGQSLGCTDANDAAPSRLEEDCPVLDMPAGHMCLLKEANLRAAVAKVTNSAVALTKPQVEQLRIWHSALPRSQRRDVRSSAAYIFFYFFPLGTEEPPRGPSGDKTAKVKPAVGPLKVDAAAGYTTRGRKRKRSALDSTLEDAMRQDEDGNVLLGGPGKAVTKPTDTWRDRVGLCAPSFERYSRDDDGAWICIRPFLQALLTEGVAGMFQGHDEKAIQLLANTLRLKGKEAWRKLTEPADGVGFVASFLGFFEQEIDEDDLFRVSLGEMLLRAVDVEKETDDLFDKVASDSVTLSKSWRNAEYCKRWKGVSTRVAYIKWRAGQMRHNKVDEDDPLVSFEHFAGLERVRPAITDSVAAKKRVGYRGKDRHAADKEGDGDSCNKAFSVICGLTQGVFNVVCPHVITLGFRCMFRAESVGEALSIILERFPKLPRVVFYDVACKLDKNAMRRVRPILRAHGVRCLLDRPHSITHGCSPSYMPDDSLGSTAGVATQAAEVSHSIAVGNRTSLAYMQPATYMIHKMVQVAFMNIRKLYRLDEDNSAGENDHINLAPFFHSRLAGKCKRGSACSCKDNTDVAGRAADGAALLASAELSGLSGETPLVDGGLHADDGRVAPDIPTDAADVPDGGMLVMSRGTAARSAPPPHVAAAETARQRPRLVSSSGLGVVSTLTRQSDGDGASMTWRQDAALQDAAPGACDLGSPGWQASHTGADDVFAPLSTHPMSTEEKDGLATVTEGRIGAARVRPVNKAKISLTVADFRRLCGEAWLNDEVMNSFVALVNHRDEAVRAQTSGAPVQPGGCPAGVTPAPSAPRTFMFNTFFHARLSERVGQYDYHGVRKWGVKLGLDLSAVDIILVPVNLHCTHWVLVKIDIARRSFWYCDSFAGSDDLFVAGPLMRWLADEVAARLGAAAAERWAVHEWSIESDMGMPRQTDGGSCGVFVLGAADCFSLGVRPEFEQAHIPVLRQRIMQALLKDTLVGAVSGAE